ncbi:MAG TPA: beta-ketoacyl-ACP synthase III [Clostridia bacterium]|nr:beta-ketoacyl-ACP synthase III [Clostridia bacterium]
MSKPLFSAGIAGLGVSVPSTVLTNDDLQSMVNTSDEWIRSRTGINTRHIADKNQSTSDLSLDAAVKALDDAGIGPEELDLIIVCTSSPDMLFPATACLVQDRLGANCGAFDLQAGCTGFIYGLSVGKQFIGTGAMENILVIGAETLSKLVNWEDRNTCVLFGDGAGAVVLRRFPEGSGIMAAILGSDGSGGNLLSLPAGGSLMPATQDTLDKNLHYIHMNGREVFKFAVKTMGDAAAEVIGKAGLTIQDIDLLIPHQANVRIIEAAARRLKMPLEKVLVNVDRYGNTSAASIPIALAEAAHTGRLSRGDRLVMVGFGAGLTWAAAVIEWDTGELR